MNRFSPKKVFNSLIRNFVFLPYSFVFIFSLSTFSDAIERLEATVLEVVDGDTVRLADGVSLRYTGIDAPEVRRRVGQEWVYAPEPFAEKATEFNRELVEGKKAFLEIDPEKSHDRHGRLLAYVFVGEVLVNEALIRRGLAKVEGKFVHPKYRRRFLKAEAEARRRRLGVWSTERRRGSRMELLPENLFSAVLAG